MKSIGKLINENTGITAGTLGALPITQPKPTGRQYHLTPLSEFTFDHLDKAQADKLKRAIELCLKWQTLAKSNKGLSLVIAGDFGTGKTTMARNVSGAWDTVARVEDEPDMELRIPGSYLFQATELMRYMGEHGQDGNGLYQWQAFILDDVGREDFGTDTYLPSDETIKFYRQTRYGRFINWAYEAGKNLIVTTNKPLVERDANGRALRFSREWVETIGDRAWDRLHAMSKGYCIDLTGLPSFRDYQVEGII